MRTPLSLCVFLCLGSSGLAAASGPRKSTTLHGVRITSFDGTNLSADVHIPQATSASERFPVVIFANSWACPQFEYVLDTVQLAGQGYLVVEYATRGWYESGGKIEAGGSQDQKDQSVVISYVLGQEAWQPDAASLALAGISYGGGLALLGAAHDERVKTALSLSGWADLERALFENGSPNLVWGSVLIASGKVLGRLDPLVSQMWGHVLRGEEAAFHDFAAVRSAVTYADALRARKVPLFLSNNMEDRLFKPQDMLDFFEGYPGPKKMLLNQGIHATAEIGGLVDIRLNHVWAEVKVWLDQWLKGRPAQDSVLVDVQLRDDRKVREVFVDWPSKRMAWLGYAPAPRGTFGLHGSLVPSAGRGAAGGAAPANESITFGVNTGMSAGVPVIGEILQVFLDKRIVSQLAFASRSHAIWYYARVSKDMRLCGTPRVSLDITASAPRWQVVAYLFSVNLLSQGTLISHGSSTCWNCTAGQRQTRKIELRTLCEDVKAGLGRGGLALGLSLYSDMYQPANIDPRLKVTFHYSDSFGLQVPEVVTAGSQGPASAIVI
mmetsp:Transcript_100497/g.313207  ORF Transcript_100497/g.313207 Transcript_100497/m.313207 type:complete len:551 (+) Transcript_100497:82-1734(+)